MTLSRREFFGRILQPVRGSDRTGGNEKQNSADFGSLAGDLPPELLAMEAESLGLAPETDRAQLMAAIHEAMLARGKPRDAEPPKG